MIMALGDAPGPCTLVTIGLPNSIGFVLSMFAAWRSGLPGPLPIGGQVGPGVARLGVGQGLLVPVRVARGWEAEHRPLPGEVSALWVTAEPVLARNPVLRGYESVPLRVVPS